MVEPTMTTYIMAGVLGLIGVVFLWACYEFNKIPRNKRPRMGMPGGTFS